MLGMQRSDFVWLLWVLAGALAFSVWGLPYFTQLGYPLLSILVYAFFAVLFLYGRANRRLKRTARSRRDRQKQEQSRP
jgi:membrane protein implicated in regulation of membrane protease activity